VVLDMKSLRSSQVAAAAGVNRQTLRYYERRGLLAEPERSAGGHRLYPADTVALLRFIKAAQRLGFSLDDIADFLDAGRTGHDGIRDAGLRARVQSRLADVEAKIADLRAVSDALRANLIARSDLADCECEPGCPIPFAALAQDGPDATRSGQSLGSRHGARRTNRNAADRRRRPRPPLNGNGLVSG
jgi:MerR family mercuric resistance operon transcriptional regulator